MPSRNATTSGYFTALLTNIDPLAPVILTLEIGPSPDPIRLPTWNEPEMVVNLLPTTGASSPPAGLGLIWSAMNPDSL